MFDFRKLESQGAEGLWPFDIAVSCEKNDRCFTVASLTLRDGQVTSLQVNI